MSRTCNVNFMDRKAPGLQRGKQDQDNQVCLLVVPLSLPAFRGTAPRVGFFPIHAFYLSSTQQLTEGIKQADSMARNPVVRGLCQAFSGTTVPDEVHTHFAFNDALKTTWSFLFCRLWGRDSHNISPSLHLHALEKQRIGRQRALLLILF